MASKLELRFTDVGLESDVLWLNGDIRYIFREQRTGYRRVTIGADAFASANNFYNAFETDDNFSGQFITSIFATPLNADGTEITGGGIHGIVTLQHPENTFFDGFSVPAFIIAELTTTVQETAATLNVTLNPSTTDICGKFLLGVNSNVISGRVTIEIPVGNVIVDITTAELPLALDRVRPSVATQGVVKLYETEFTTEELKKVFFTAPGVTSISSIDVSGTPFGASAKINAAGPGLQYSLNGTDYQSSNEFIGLLAGNFTAYVKDSFGCNKTKTFTVTEDQVSGLTAPPYINIPIHNSIRFANRKDNLFLGYLSTETPGHVQISNYRQDYLQTDIVRTQFKSSYANNRVFLINEIGAETEIATIKKSDNISRINIYEGNYTSYEGRLAVYFNSGDIYNKDGTIKSTHSLNGLLPSWYEEGMYINIEGIGVTRIDRIAFDENVERVYAITLLNGAGDGLSKKITSIHTAHPYEVYEFDVHFNLPEGKYQLRVEYGDNFFLSEIIQVWGELPENYLTVQWYNEVNNDILYNTGIRHLRRLEWEDYFKLVPEAEIESNRTDTGVDKINSKTYAVYNLTFREMPMEVFRGLQTGFDNSSDIWINGVKFATEKGMEYDDLGQWYLPRTQLTLTEQTMKGQQTILDAVIPEFLIVDDANGYSFLNLQE
jgi:hypothetical protein